METRRYISLAFWAKERHEVLDSIRKNVIALDAFTVSVEHHTREAAIVDAIEISSIEEAA